MEQVLVVGLIIFLITLSALCSGLNVALVSLDAADLRRMAQAGNKQAAIAIKLRQRTHLVLASILFTNVALISAISLFMSRYINGFLAGFISTILILIFGEIIPQALSIRNSLGVIARFAFFLKAITVITYPITKPMELLLDKLLGKSEKRLHTRQELGILFTEYLDSKEGELDEDEVEIVRNAIMLSEKQVKDIMTPIDHIYSLNSGTLINGPKVDEMKRQNWSRIPVIDKNSHQYSFVLLKDLVDMDFNDAPMKVDNLKRHTTKAVGSKTALDTLFRIFIQAKKHLLIVESKDEVVGIVTIEDLIEEILGHEIEDESDVEKLKLQNTPL